MKLIDRYVADGFSDLSVWSEDEEENVVNFINDHAEKAPRLYRGLQDIDPESIEYLIGEHQFCSMSSDLDAAENFGDIILVVDGLSGYHVTGGLVDEWIVEDQKVYIDRVEKRDGLTFVYAEV